MYTQLKDIVLSAIPAPDPKSALSDAMFARLALDHFVYDDAGGADSFGHVVDNPHEC